MPYDGIFTKCIINEMQCTVDARIDKVYQPSKDEIILQCKRSKESFKVLVSANPSSARLSITKFNFENPKSAPNFCMMLRKKLTGSKIKSIEQQELDRIVKINFDSQDELGYPVLLTLIIEIMGKHSNIILVDKDYKIIDCIKHVGIDIDRFRQVLPGNIYVNPPVNNKLNPLTTSKDQMNKLITENMDLSIGKFFINNFLGISKIFSKQICGDFFSTPIKELDSFKISEITSNFYYYLIKIKNNDFNNLLYYDDNVIKDYYIFNLNEYNSLKCIEAESCNEMLDLFFNQKDLKNTLKQKYNSIFKLVHNLIDRNNKKIEIYTSKINECSNFKIFKEYGDILMANQYSISSVQDSVKLLNFYSGIEIEIPLDNTLNIVDNAMKYYKKYSKFKNTIDMVEKQLNDANNEKEYFESVILNLENANDVETIEEIKNELTELNYIKKKRYKGYKVQKSLPYHYISQDGFDIYVGKNNYQNDYLTIKFAVSSDVWMHTKDIPGSHVIIKSQNGEISDNALLEGSMLAAYYSKGRNSSNVAVDYTQKKNVKKPTGAKPGKVIYYTNKTIYVTPEEDKIKLISKK